MLSGSEGTWAPTLDVCVAQVIPPPQLGATLLGYWIQRCVTFHWNGPPPTRVHEYTGVCQNKQSKQAIGYEDNKSLGGVPCHQVAGSILHTGQCHNSEELEVSCDGATSREKAY